MGKHQKNVKYNRGAKINQRLTDIQFIDNKNEWIQQGMAYEIKDKGN